MIELWPVLWPFYLSLKHFLILYLVQQQQLSHFFNASFIFFQNINEESTVTGNFSLLWKSVCEQKLYDQLL